MLAFVLNKLGFLNRVRHWSRHFHCLIRPGSNCCVEQAESKGTRTGGYSSPWCFSLTRAPIARKRAAPAGIFSDRMRVYLYIVKQLTSEGLVWGLLIFKRCLTRQNTLKYTLEYFSLKWSILWYTDTFSLAPEVSFSFSSEARVWYLNFLIKKRISFFITFKS